MDKIKFVMTNTSDIVTEVCREVLEAIDLDRIRSNGYSFQIEMTHTAWKLGFRVVEVPIIFEDRRSGQSKMNTAIIREALGIVLRLRFRRPPGKKPA